MACERCGREHAAGVPCPPPRGRSNALAGWVDGRAPIPALERDLRAQLMMPAVMAVELQAFLIQVYGNAAIMHARTEPYQRTDGIYALYNAVAGGGHGADRREADQFIIDIADAAGTVGLLHIGTFQYTKKRLFNAYTALMTGEEIDEGCYTDFILFGPMVAQAPAVRIYLNVKFGSIPALVELIGERWMHHHAPIHSYKVAGPDAAASRSDTIVVYMLDRDGANGLAGFLADQQFSAHYNVAVPALTSRVAAGIGVSMGAEPAWQATGLGRITQYGEKAQSFGSVRSQLISMAIENYLANPHYPRSFDIFCRFVCIAFRSYGLNPQRPGD